jgi:hypothetical protein
VYVPENYYKLIIDKILEYEANYEYDKRIKNFILPCDGQVPKIDILLGGYWLQMSPEDYLIPTRVGSDRCFICIFAEFKGVERWLLGDSFLRGYYSLYNYDTRMFGLTPHSTSSKPFPLKAKSSDEGDNPLPGWAWGLIICSIIGVISTVIWYIVSSSDSKSAIIDLQNQLIILF